MNHGFMVALFHGGMPVDCKVKPCRNVKSDALTLINLTLRLVNLLSEKHALILPHQFHEGLIINLLSTLINLINLKSMKRIILFLAAFLPMAIHAQQTEGEVTYTETIKLQIDFGDGPEAEEMKKMMPSTQSFPKTLYFNAEESLYQDKQGTEEEGDVEMSGSSGGGDFQIKIQRPDNKYYRNMADGSTIEYREFFGRYFLITDKAKMPAWKIMGEQKKLLGYTCMKATLQVDSATNVVAWFTSQIPVSTGPSIHAGLPGLILEFSMNDGQRTMVASQIEFKTLPKGTLEKPSKGKEVTAEEFKKIEAEKMKEMGMEAGPGGGGAVRMIIRN